MKDLHVKTHFKAASIFSLALNNSENKKNLNKSTFSYLENNKYTTNDSFSNSSFDKKEKNRIKNKSLDYNPILYNLDFNPLRVKKEIECDIETLNYLEKISKPDFLIKPVQEIKKKHKEYSDIINAMRNNKNTGVLKSNPIEFFLNFKEEMKNGKVKKEDEKITISGETYFKSQLDIISQKILKQCNYTKEKNINNKAQLKVGNGKLSVTGGMTVNEFKNKHNLFR